MKIVNRNIHFDFFEILYAIPCKCHIYQVPSLFAYHNIFEKKTNKDLVQTAYLLRPSKSTSTHSYIWQLFNTYNVTLCLCNMHSIDQIWTHRFSTQECTKLDRMSINDTKSEALSTSMSTVY